MLFSENFILKKIILRQNVTDLINDYLKRTLYANLQYRRFSR